MDFWYHTAHFIFEKMNFPRVWVSFFLLSTLHSDYVSSQQSMLYASFILHLFTICKAIKSDTLIDERKSNYQFKMICLFMINRNRKCCYFCCFFFQSEFTSWIHKERKRGEREGRKKVNSYRDLKGYRKVKCESIIVLKNGGISILFLRNQKKQ